MNVASLELCEELYEVRDVVGLEDRFTVSNDGEIISKPSRTGVGKIRKQWQDNLGYCYVTYIDWLIKKRKKIIVHRAVAQAFLPNPDNLPVVNHKDSVTSHNHVHNLEWVTIKGNVQDSIKRGTFVYFGRKNG